MERNLYSPPSAPVSDITKPDITGVRPHQVSVAVMLLCLSLALGQLTSALLRPNLPHNPPAVFVAVFTVVTLAWLTYKIWAGRNWARMTFSALTILGLAVYAPILMKFFQISPIAGSINLLAGLLQLVAIYLLFTEPGRGWFKPRLPAGT
jgi:hypothetical protein